MTKVAVLGSISATAIAPVVVAWPVSQQALLGAYEAIVRTGAEGAPCLF